MPEPTPEFPFAAGHAAWLHTTAVAERGAAAADAVSPPEVGSRR